VPVPSLRPVKPPGLDLAFPTREARRFAGRLQSGLASGLARTVGNVPEQRLEQAMRTPLRRVVLDALFRGVPRVLDGTRAGEVTSTVRCHVTGRPDGGFDVYWLEVEQGSWRARRGTPASDGGAVAEPELTITVDGTELVRLACRSSSPIQAYLSGKLRASGNPIVAARLGNLFTSPSATGEADVDPA
jgi:hypothetical protein